MPHNNHLLNILDTVDSTNNYAMQQVYAGMASHGEGFMAFFQTTGKGQRGRHWLSEEGKNIALSIALKPSPVTLSGQFYLSAAVALGAYDFLFKYTGDEVSIKWPNDLYWRDRKAGGILIENVITGRHWKWAVAGIGINVNQVVFDGILQNPVSIKQITGKKNDVVALTKELQHSVLKRVNHLLRGHKTEILKEYNARLYKINTPVRLKKENVVFETVIKGVDAHGCLHTKDMLDKRYNFGEIEWIV